MTHDFEYISYDEADRIAILENRAAELERRLLAVTPPGGMPRWANVGFPDDGYPAMPAADESGPEVSYPEAPYREDPFPDESYLDELPGGGTPGPAAGGPGRGRAAGEAALASLYDRTEALINHGRQRAKRARGLSLGRKQGLGLRRFTHWRLVAVGVVALVAGLVTALVATGGSGPGWPASVANVKAEIKAACANPNVAAEPSGGNFACDAGTQSVLWVFSLLTSGNNPGYVDQGTGRKGLEPIQPAQGGDIAWALNLHHPYDAADPVDSLEVAARAINNIVSGATLTSSSGAADVQSGLESKAANCQRYTGSAQLVTRSGYPARCAVAVTSAAGQAALVSDVFKQWMGGEPAAFATDAGVLFENSGNPGNAQVQAILGSLPASGS
jgi:hypothetical protein